MTPSYLTQAPPSDPAILAGFEWEFLVAHSKQGIDHHPYDERWFSQLEQSSSTSTTSRNGTDNASNKTFLQMLRSYSYSNILSKVDDILRDAGLAVHSDPDDLLPEAKRNEEIENVLFLKGLEPTRNVHPEYMVYSTSNDSSLHTHDEDSDWLDGRYTWRGCEVKSRVFTEDQLTTKTQVGLAEKDARDKSICLKEVTRLCSNLRANMRLQINQTCALQVTLSHQQNRGFDLLSLKKILTLAWILEPMLFALCAPHRRDGSNIYCRPIREYSELAKTELNETPQSILGYKDPHSLEAVMEAERGYVSYWERQFSAHVGAGIADALIMLTSGIPESPLVHNSHQENRESHRGNQKENQNPNQNTSLKSGTGTGTGLKNTGTSSEADRPGPSKGKDKATPTRSPHHHKPGLVNYMEKLTHHLRQIWLAPTSASLASMIQERSYGARGGVSFHSQRIAIAVKLLGSTSPLVTGIEFRMHEGTLDPVLSKMWMDICVALVRKAVTPGSGGNTTPSSSLNSSERSPSSQYGMSTGLGDSTHKPEIRNYAHMIRDFVQKMAGINSADDIYSASGKVSCKYTPSNFLSDLGIPQREVALWEKKIRSFRGLPFPSDLEAANPWSPDPYHSTDYMNSQSPPSDQPLNNRLSSADLQVDIACSVPGAYKNRDFLPKVCLDQEYGLYNDLEFDDSVFPTPPRRSGAESEIPDHGKNETHPQPRLAFELVLVVGSFLVTLTLMQD